MNDASLYCRADGNVVGTGSEDASSILFDLRAHGPLNKFSDDSVMLGIFSVCFSKSGRLMFAGYEERMCYAWETISSEGYAVTPTSCVCSGLSLHFMRYP